MLSCTVEWVWVKFHQCPHWHKICCPFHLKGCAAPGLPTPYCFMRLIRLFHRFDCVSIGWCIMTLLTHTVSLPQKDVHHCQGSDHIFKLTPTPRFNTGPKFIYTLVAAVTHRSCPRFNLLSEVQMVTSTRPGQTRSLPVCHCQTRLCGLQGKY